MKCMDTTRFIAGLIFFLILPNAYAETVSVTRDTAAIFLDSAPMRQPTATTAVSSSNGDALIAARLRAKDLKLASSLYWQRLMHYHQHGQGVKSRVTQTIFFLAKDGSTNPEAELDATLQGLFSPNPAKPDESTACLFPVRRDWLVQAARPKHAS